MEQEQWRFHDTGDPALMAVQASALAGPQARADRGAIPGP